MFINGARYIQCIEGDFSTGQYIKQPGNTLEFIEAIDADSVVTIRNERAVGSISSSSFEGFSVADEGADLSNAVKKLNFQGDLIEAVELTPEEIIVKVNTPAGSVYPDRKRVYNNTGSTLLANRIASWKNDGSVEYATASNFAGSDFAGIIKADIPNGSYGWVIKLGVMKDVLTGIPNLAPGKELFLSDNNDGSLTINPPPAPSAIIRIGNAEPPDFDYSAPPTDLFINFDIISYSSP